MLNSPTMVRPLRFSKRMQGCLNAVSAERRITLWGRHGLVYANLATFSPHACLSFL